MHACIRGALLSIALALLASQMVLAEEGGAVAGVTAPDTLATIFEVPPIVVEGRRDDLVGISISASEGRVGIADLELRPLLRVGELLETVPGMIMTQHSGSGKGNQMFVRGFNLDHGTDFHTLVDGMPVNLPTHAHGQGYTDINFLIPELVDHLEFRKGTYYADVGDFSSAGTGEFELVHTLPEAIVSVQAGENNYARGLAAVSKNAGAGAWLLAAELQAYDGPWTLEEDLQKINALARYSWESGSSDFSIMAMAYDNSWNSTDQIPRRAVMAGAISRLGHIDPTDGGRSSRYSLSGNWVRARGDTRHRARVYGMYYDLDLWSNFTYLLADSVNGDQFQQSDERFVVGGSYDYATTADWLGVAHQLTIGFQSRMDIIQGVGLYATRARKRLSTVREDEILESGNGLYAIIDTRWKKQFRSSLGVRGDVYYFDVQSDLAVNSGTASQRKVSPKVALTIGPFLRSELYLNAGLGFHTNDARGTTITVDPATGDPAERVDPIVESRGAEIGFRANPTRKYRMTLSAWALELDSELLYVGDAGTTEASDGSRRYGIEWTNYFEPFPWLAVAFDYAYSHARFVDVPQGQDYIPGALEHVVNTALTVKPTGRTGWFGSLRLRYFSGYPLIEDNSQRAGTTKTVNLGIGYQLGAARFGFTVFNLLDAGDNDIEYYYASRLPDELVDGVDDRHFHPLEPRTIRAGIEYGF